LCIKRWRIKAQERKEWPEIVREAKAKLKGPRRQRRRREEVWLQHVK
jgi:hypothetical protein